MVNRIMVDLQTAGHHHRCYRDKATVRYILGGRTGVEFIELATGKVIAKVELVVPYLDEEIWPQGRPLSSQILIRA